MQIMLHVPLVVDQVLYAYHKKRKAGTIPKNVLNCWIDLFFWFFFLSSGIFQLWVTPVSVTGGLQTVLGSSLLWRYIGRANNSCGLESSPSPAYLRLADERNISQKGSALFDSWELLPILPSLPSASPDWRRVFFTMIAKARASLWVEDLQKQLPWFSLVLSARSLGVCSISKLPWSAHTKGFVLAVSV